MQTELHKFECAALTNWSTAADDHVSGMGGSAGISAAQGIQGWMRAFDRFASAVSGAAAQVGSDAANQTGSSSDMIDGMIGMHLAAAGVKANVAVFRTADEMLGSLLDMKA